MTCEHHGPLVLCRPNTWTVRKVRYCPTCERRRRFTGTHLGVWYGMAWTCHGCGDSWMDGELRPRPFKPRWREEEKERARQGWAEALSPEEAHRALEAELAAL